MILLLAGCAGGGSAFDSDEAGDKPQSTYSGLSGQTCAILVWADSQTRAEFNQVQVDLARVIQTRLVSPPKEDKPDPSAAQFVDPRSVVRYQREHPEIDGMPIAEVAPKLGVGRVVYVEVEELQTQSPRTSLLLRGYAKATLRVVEVTGGQVHIAYEDAGITAVYPRNSLEGVVPTDTINARTIYEGTLTALGNKVAARLKVKG